VREKGRRDRPVAGQQARGRRDAVAAPGKRIVAKNVTTQPLGSEPSNAMRYALETVQGMRVCWELGKVNADEFLASVDLKDSKSVFFKSPNLRVFFPVKTEYYVVKSFKISKPITMVKVLRCIEAAAKAAVAHYVVKTLGDNATSNDISVALNKLAVCELLFRRTGGINSNQVYVNLS
jgi:hypothetical protein